MKRSQRARWRSVVAACAATGAVVAATAAPAVAAHDVVPGFAEGRPSAAAMMRWWWPDAAVEPRQLLRELDAIGDAGYSGVEIAAVIDSATYAIDPDRYGYGTPRWNDAVERVLAAADRRGLQVDLSLGGRWPAAIPGLDVDGPTSSKELAYGTAQVAGGTRFDGELPAAAPRTYEVRTSENGRTAIATRTARAELVAVGALRCTATPCAGRPLQVDLGSWVDLTARVRDGRLDWTAPDGAWVLTTFWQRGTGQRNDAPYGRTATQITDPEARAVDHFGAAGADAMLAYMGGLLDRRTRALIGRAGGSLFEDSLELTHTAAWTPRMREEFRARRGYDLTPFLPVLAADIATSPFVPGERAFAFPGAEATVARFERDMAQTLNDLYVEHHLKPIQRWANALGLRYRAQPYGEPIDLGQASSLLDVVECESLGCGSLSDDWRAMTAGADLGGRRLVSSEMLPGGFGTTYGNTQQDIVRQANAEYASGANHMVFHGFPYARWAPAAKGTAPSGVAGWPGYHAFAGNIPEALGPRQPTWGMERDVAGYHRRVQTVLQSGTRKTDVALYDQTLGHLGAEPRDAGLAAAGYTHGLVSPATLALPSARVSGGRLAPRGPAYKALVVAEQATMPAATVQRLRALADAGLPIVVVGEPPAAAPGWGADAASVAAADEAVRRASAALVAHRNVHRVATRADVPRTLAALGVRPDAQVAGRAALRSVHRAIGATDAYFLHNPARRAVDARVTLTGRRGAVPVALDAWTGAGDALAVLRRRAGRVTTRVEIPAGGAAIVALASPRRVAGAAAGAERRRGAVRLTRWRLTVDEHLPGRGRDAATTTRHVTRRIGRTPLRPWTSIPALRDAVGVGAYRTTVRLPRGAARDVRALLDLGAIGGSARVWVNGRWAGPVDQLDPRVDLGRLLRPGRNAIRVQVATTLLNRLRVTRPDEFAERDRQAYGLLGPVRLVRYAAVSRADGR